MATLQEQLHTNVPDLPYDAQRGDVPYHWPRGPEERAPREVQLNLFWFAVSMITFVLATIVIWYMVTHSGCSGYRCAG
jgi:hypothetical protein